MSVRSAVLQGKPGRHLATSIISVPNSSCAPDAIEFSAKPGQVQGGRLRVRPADVEFLMVNLVDLTVLLNTSGILDIEILF